MQEGLKMKRLRMVRSMLVTAIVVGVASASSGETPAFPGAEGAGAQAAGGRGGTVVYVTNLDDHGPGSLREAVSKPRRTVVFAVSGTITLEKRLNIERPHITIAGQTAPGDGICIRGKDVIIGADDCIVRFLRFRPGDIKREEHDALTVWGAHDVIVDHCSMSWSTDSLNDVVKESGNVTVQWCILSEPLRQSAHAKGAHGYGTGWDGRRGASSYHHNLLAHCDSRAPRIEKAGPGVLVDIRNMVIYNIGGGFAYGGEKARFNYVANFLKPGPSTVHPATLFLLSSPESRGYFAENFMAGSPEGSQNNARAVRIDGDLDAGQLLVKEPFDVPAVATQSPQDAYDAVLAHAGAVLPARDAVDRRIVADVEAGTGGLIDSQDDVGGWPELKSTAPPADSDRDGMPDDWERKHNLDPDDASDGSQIADRGYTHLETYLNELARPAWPEDHPATAAASATSP
jgi:pectate lyase